MSIGRVHVLVGFLLPAFAADAQLAVTHGTAAGDVTATSAIVWARASAPAEMSVEVDDDPGFSHPRRFTAAADAFDLTAQVAVDGLAPASRYHYRVVFANEGGRSESAAGSFATAPEPGEARPVRFVVGGDVGGQGYCRHAETGYAIFGAMAALEPDFFIANGDMIYADAACPAQGPEGWPNLPGDFPSIDDPRVDWTDAGQVREVYLDHWRYNRADPHVQGFHARVPVYAQWDDHEVINDFGARWASWSKAPQRAGYPNLVAAGRQALFAWNPIARHRDEPERIYRSFRWGRDIELFLLDARSYRSVNDLSERPDHTKTMLGEAQLAWLIDGLTRSDASWKVVSSDVPLSVPTGSQAQLYGRDGFADGGPHFEGTGFAERTGYERELRRLLAALDAADVEGVVFVVTDVHFAMNLRYAADVDGDGDPLVFHELVSGPLNAVRAAGPPRLDPSFRPVILYAEGDLFNFSYVRVERRGGEVALTADVRGADGAVRFGSRLELTAAAP
ncbi:MAG TPA: alkaline phosphatase D family protein [Thermoanaerobaculia bacterium]